MGQFDLLGYTTTTPKKRGSDYSSLTKTGQPAKLSGPLNQWGSATATKVYNSPALRYGRGVFNTGVYYGTMAGRATVSAPLQLYAQKQPVYRNANKQDPSRFPMQSWKGATLDPMGGVLKTYDTLLKARDATGEKRIHPAVQTLIRGGALAVDVVNPADALALGGAVKGLKLAGKGTAAVARMTPAGRTLAEKGAQHLVATRAHRFERLVSQKTRLEGHEVIREIDATGKKYAGKEGGKVAGEAIGRVIDAGADAAEKAKREAVKSVTQHVADLTRQARTGKKRVATLTTRERTLVDQGERLTGAAKGKQGVKTRAEVRAHQEKGAVQNLKQTPQVAGRTKLEQQVAKGREAVARQEGAVDALMGVPGKQPNKWNTLAKLRSRQTALEAELDMAKRSGLTERISELERSLARTKERYLIAQGGESALLGQKQKIDRLVTTIGQKKQKVEATVATAERRLDPFRTETGNVSLKVGPGQKIVQESIITHAQRQSAVARELATRAETALPNPELRRLIGLTQEHVGAQAQAKLTMGQPYGLIDDFEARFFDKNYLKRKYLKDIDRGAYTDSLEDAGRSEDEVFTALNRENPTTQVVGPRNPVNKAKHDRTYVPPQQRERFGEIVDARIRIALGDQETGAALGRIGSLGILSDYTRRAEDLGEAVVGASRRSYDSRLGRALRFTGLGDNPWVQVPPGSNYGVWLGLNTDEATRSLVLKQRELDAAMRSGDVAAAEKAADAVDKAKLRLSNLQAEGVKVRDDVFAQNPMYIPNQILLDFNRNTRVAGLEGLLGANKGTKAIDSATGAIAAMKVPGSLATRLANRISNRFMATQYGGMIPLLDEYWLQQGAKARKTENAWWREAQETDPVFSAGLASDRAMDMDASLSVQGGPIRQAIRKFLNSYGETELDDKLGGYIKRRSVYKDTPQQAAEWARNVFLDYGEAPAAARYLADSTLMKFARFPFLSTMALGRSLDRNPLGTTGFLNLSKDWDYAVGGTPEGRDELLRLQQTAAPYYRNGIVKALPAPGSVIPWLTGSGDMRMARNTYGDVVHADLTRYSPMGAALAVGSEGLNQANPLKSGLLAKPIFTAFTGHDQFTDRDIWTEGMPLWLKAVYGGQSLLEGAMPSQAPGGNLFNNWAGAMNGKIGPSGVPVDKTAATARWLTGLSFPATSVEDNLKADERRVKALNADVEQYKTRMKKMGFDYPLLMKMLDAYQDERAFGRLR